MFVFATKRFRTCVFYIVHNIIAHITIISYMEL